MRTRLRLAALPLLLAGCISNDNTTPAEDAGQPSEDGSIPATEDSGQPPQDATVPVDSATTDSAAPPVDAADAGPGPVTLLITNDVGPEPGVLVLFHDPAGTVIGSAKTGTSGTVTQQLAAGSQVTAVLQGARGMAFVTIQGVQPGDALTAFDSTNVAFTGSSVAVDLPDATPPTGAVNYGAYIGNCSGGGTGSPIAVGNVGFPCELQGKYPTLLTATSSGGQEVGYAYGTGNVLPIDGGNAEVMPSFGWLSDETAPLVFLVSPPAQPGDGGGYTGYTVAYEEIAGNVPYTQTQSPSVQADGGYVGSFTSHTSYPDSVQIEGTGRNDLYDPAASANIFESIGSVATRGGPPDGSAIGSVDMSQLLPQLVGAQINANDAGTASQPIVTWTSLGSLASTDGIVVVAFFSLTFGDGGAVSSVPWSIVLPPSATSATPPVLPASVGTPAVIMAQYTVPTVMAVEASYLSGYAQMRQAAATLVPPINEFNVGSQQFQNSGYGPVAPTLPVDGTLRLTAITASGD